MAKFLDSIKVKEAIDKRTNIDLSCSHVTTANFMQFNCAFSRELVPKQKISINMSTFARLQPLPVPTYGKAKIQNRCFFVPFRTIFPAFNDFITDARHSFSNGNSGMVLSTPKFTLGTFIGLLLGGFDTGKYAITSNTDTTITEDNSDYIFRKYERSNGADKNTLVYVKLTKKGRWLMKLMNSLGYNFPFAYKFGEYEDNFDLEYSALPLLSVAKVYADWYYPSMYASTPEFSYLESMFNHDISSSYDINQDELNVLFTFLQNVSYDSDYFTSAWQNPVAPNSGTFSEVHIPDTTSKYDYTFPGQPRPVPGIRNQVSNSPITGDGTPTINNPLSESYLGSISQYALDALKSLTDYLKRHQLVGGRALDRYLARFGVKLSDEILKRSTYVGSFDNYIQFGDVVSQSATSDAVLGDYAGKGIGYADGKFTYENGKEYGMLIIISTLVPVVGYYQGIDRNVMHTTRLDFWTPEFDGLGVQAISRAELYVPEHNADLIVGVNPQTYYNSVFGFAPRYAEYKLAQDRLTGDFRYNSINRGMDSWHTMRQINPSTLDLAITQDFVFGNDAEQYSRIFYNTDDEFDKFIVIHNFDIKSSTPFSSYWDTYEFDSKGDDIVEQANGVKMN